MPISDRSFREVLKCLNPQEEVWIDQLYINQADKKEKAEAITSIGLVYINARLVAIMLGNVEHMQRENCVVVLCCGGQLSCPAA